MRASQRQAAAEARARKRAALARKYGVQTTAKVGPPGMLGRERQRRARVGKGDSSAMLNATNRSKCEALLCTKARMLCIIAQVWPRGTAFRANHGGSSQSSNGTFAD